MGENPTGGTIEGLGISETGTTTVMADVMADVIVMEDVTVVIRIAEEARGDRRHLVLPDDDSPMNVGPPSRVAAFRVPLVTRRVVVLPVDLVSSNGEKSTLVNLQYVR